MGMSDCLADDWFRTFPDPGKSGGPLPTPKLRTGIPSARFQYFTFQGGIDAQVRDDIERGDLVARFSQQRRYPARRVAKDRNHG